MNKISRTIGPFIFALTISEGLLSDDPQLPRVLKFINLESGFLVGVILAVLGLGTSLVALRV
jgi:hypothetical protein